MVRSVSRSPDRSPGFGADARGPVSEVVPTGFAARAATLERLPNGALVLRHGLELAPYDAQVGTWLRRGSEAAPDRRFLAEWAADGTLLALTYAEARAACDRISQALLDRGCGVERPVAILSEKSLAHALLTLAAIQVGIPVAPISPAFSLRPEARSRLAFCLARLTPGLVLVEDGPDFEAALALVPAEVELVHVRRPSPGRRSTPFGDLAAPPLAVDAAFAAVNPDAPAKILFTSGSTGDPKPVINTHRMMCSNAKAQAQLLPFLTARPPVVVDWQPWHHCGGSSHNFHAVLAQGGTYYLDAGKPTTDAAFAPTLAALRAVSPTVHFNVPQGYARLAFHLARDPELSGSFFAELDALIYSAAAMPVTLWEELERLARLARGARVPMLSSYGMTEMAPLHASLHWHENAPGHIGLPVPGSAVKLVPSHGRLELRAKGPNVTPGYFRDPDLTAAAFDEEGWYRSGDAVRLVDPDDPARGLVFEGRLTEEFKLLTGAWVAVGQIRTAVIDAAAPYIQDALVVGEGRPELALLAFPNLDACREELGRSDLSLAEAAASPVIARKVAEGLARYNAVHSASSRRIGRALLTADLPSLARGETTDKGYINQRLAVSRRAGLVAALYAGEPPVIRL